MTLREALAADLEIRYHLSHRAPASLARIARTLDESGQAADAAFVRGVAAELMAAAIERESAGTIQ